jgi:chromosome segregation ATPase
MQDKKEDKERSDELASKVAKLVKDHESSLNAELEEKRSRISSLIQELAEQKQLNNKSERIIEEQKKQLEEQKQKSEELKKRVNTLEDDLKRIRENREGFHAVLKHDIEQLLSHYNKAVRLKDRIYLSEPGTNKNDSDSEGDLVVSSAPQHGKSSTKGMFGHSDSVPSVPVTIPAPQGQSSSLARGSSNRTS